MKSLKSALLAIVLFIGVYGCLPKDELQFPVMEEETLIVRSDTVYSEFLVWPNFVESTDPNLDTTWDWMDGVYVGTFSNKTFQENSAEITFPWFTQGNAMNIINPDIKPEDGWRLAFRDFGMLGRINPMPFFSLYNSQRGVLKVFIYNAQNIETSHFLGNIALKIGPEISFIQEGSSANANQYDGWINLEYKIPNLKIPFDSQSTSMQIKLMGIQQWVLRP